MEARIMTQYTSSHKGALMVSIHNHTAKGTQQRMLSKLKYILWIIIHYAYTLLSDTWNILLYIQKLLLREQEL